MSQILYMLIGPKGAGKTYIGTLIGRCTTIQFIRVEPIWLSLQPGENGWQKVAQIIDETFKNYPQVMIESLGAGEEFERFRTVLAKKYTLKMIRIYADLETCLTRVKNRDSADHIPVSDDKVEQYNRIAANVVYDWDLEINNDVPATEDAILAAIQTLL
ncbi:MULTISPECIES: shikimate kinase [unclassified Leptolyngbya]|uniref:shikimate kinase n=1 Tax=unclassified Leptolyngbya TaxID=2650499 RepID=UPI001685E3A6|nr:MULTISPECIES: shikimate kinase [unclassified Leptolyngbya]MBD1913629.1 shikimate kinase [Leptolyngbya sp. FACHB-8]MBD2154040.1 shikimate kinase [Leptolyngbya sp. FACHB-16]